MAGGSKPKDLTGNVYGRLTALERLEMSPNAGYFWKCFCSCGNFTKVTIGNLNSGHTNSCGCLSVEVSADKHRTHGMSKTKEYKCWIKMRERCLSPNDKEYPNYGAIGVTIQDSWQQDFQTFFDFMGNIQKTGDDILLTGLKTIEATAKVTFDGQLLTNKPETKDYLPLTLAV